MRVQCERGRSAILYKCSMYERSTQQYEYECKCQNGVHGEPGEYGEHGGRGQVRRTNMCLRTPRRARRVSQVRSVNISLPTPPSSLQGTMDTSTWMRVPLLRSDGLTNTVLCSQQGSKVEVEVEAPAPAPYASRRRPGRSLQLTCRTRGILVGR